MTTALDSSLTVALLRDSLISHNSLRSIATNQQRRTGKILLWELNIICPNETCGSQMHKMILS